MNAHLEGALTKVREFVEKSFDGNFEVYDVKFRSERKRLILEVKIDSPDGIRVKDCETVSRSLSGFLDENEHLIPGSYILEVSSPGAERTLKREVDFKRSVGRLVRWVLKPVGADKKEVFKARLQEFSSEKIVVLRDGKILEFPLSRVAGAKIVLEFPPNARG